MCLHHESGIEVIRTERAWLQVNPNLIHEQGNPWLKLTKTPRMVSERQWNELTAVSKSPSDSALVTEPELNRAKTTDSDFAFATRSLINRRTRTGLSSATLERVASSMFVIGSSPSQPRELPLRRAISLSQDANLPRLSSQASVGRNSKFHNLTAEDREQLGGIEYRSLKLLLKIVIGEAVYLEFGCPGSSDLARILRRFASIRCDLPRPVDSPCEPQVS